VDRGHARLVDRGEVHAHHVGARVRQQVDGRAAHPGRAPDHQRALAVVAERVEQAHVDLLAGRDPFAATPWQRAV
jgi:hypothetical protein